eukprot:TRINITY_DN105866_c0_g1_i1.p1 TRINITY_DN105866_c0_g1~~TRINITY_DN105866_c0_g1_i1.p1  ORF type:complete len:1029 (+),score=206.69 TRINITY_DN105866_c0_g1_i1:50-3136(+)
MASKDRYDQVVHTVAAELQDFLSCENEIMQHFVSDTVCPFLVSTIQMLCYAMPRDPAAFLICRTLEERKLHRHLLSEVQEWLWCSRHNATPKGKLEIADGDVSGGCGAAVPEPVKGPMKPQPPTEKAQSTGANPKSKFIKHVETSEASIANEAENDQKRKKPKEVNSDGEEVWDGASSSSSDDDEEDTYSPARKVLAASQSPNKRASQIANPMMARQRRFTVALGLQDLPPPPREEVISILKESPMFSSFTQDEQMRIASLVKCSEFDEDEMLVNAGEKLDAIHYIVSGEARLSVPKDMGCVEAGNWFGGESLKFKDVKSQYQVVAASGRLKTLSIKGADFRALNLKKHLITKHKEKDDRKAGRAANETHKLAKDEQSEDVCALTGMQKVKGYQQTEADRNLIASACRSNKVLGDVLHLSKEQLSHICSSVYLVEVPESEVLIRAGDRGKFFCIVHNGLLEMEIAGSIGKHSIQKVPGDSFGELTVMYSTQHEATVTAIQSSKLWVLQMREFHAVMHLNCQSRIASYSEMLLKIPCVSAVADKSSIDLFAGALEELSFQEGDDICTEGEDAGQLFILCQGEAQVQQGGKAVGKMMKGSWVGEDALTKSCPSEYTVTVTSENASVITMGEANYNVILKAVTSLKKGKTYQRTSFSGAQNGALAEELDHIDRNNYADGVMKKVMAQVQEETLHGSAQPGRKTKGRGSLLAETIIDVGQLEKVGALGEGSFGLVLFMRGRNNEEYALKCLVKEQIRKEDMAQSVSNERTILALMDSPFVCKLHGTWQDLTYIYFLCEPVLGGELFDVYTDNDFFGELNHSRFYISCVILGLMHIHSKRVVYRDLKLENCLLGSDGYVKLADMGIAKVVVGKTYTVCGTADYLAPETLKQTGHNRGADWWACGVLLFIMCAGQSPFDAPEVNQIYKGIMKGFSKVSMPDNFPSDLVDVIKSLCRKLPEERVPMQKGGVENLQEMPYFSSIDWEKLQERQLKPPFLPAALDEEKLKTKKLSREITIDKEHVTIWNGGLPSGVS